MDERNEKQAETENRSCGISNCFFALVPLLFLIDRVLIIVFNSRSFNEEFNEHFFMCSTQFKSVSILHLAFIKSQRREDRKSQFQSRA